MRWKGRKQSRNIEDRRGTAPRRVIGGGISTLVLLGLVWLLGGNPLDLLNVLQTAGGAGGESTYQESARDRELAQFVSVVLHDTEEVWNLLFRQNGREYREPKLVLYSQSVQSACGFSRAATGPFYCPGDDKVYIDLSFCEELQQRLQAPGDFAMAYVIAHEVGHHVQNLLGINKKVMEMRGRVSQSEFNRYMVRLELQADFFAGVWAHHAQRMNHILEEGDIEEALNAASAVGDDRIQKQTRGYVVPESFTHGTSEQRRRWFSRGLQSGDMSQGNPFEAAAL